jgi:Bacterial surface proteins containing Ig-like domains
MKYYLLKVLTICTMALFAFSGCDDDDESTVFVTGVSIDNSTIEMVLEVGQTGTMTAMITPEEATNKNVTWNSDNDAVASIDQDGIVTAIAVGTATITVKTKDGDKTDSRKVVVADGPFVNFENVHAEYYGATENKPAHFILNLTTVGKALHLEFYGDEMTDSDTPTLKPGDYSVATGAITTPGTFIPGSATDGSIYTVDDASVQMVANGKFTISLSGTDYIVDIALKDNEDKEIKGNYTGSITVEDKRVWPDSDFVEGFVYFEGKLFNNISHLFYVGMISEGITIDRVTGRYGGNGTVVRIPFFGDTESIAEIPAGTYTVVNTDNPSPGDIIVNDKNTYFAEYVNGKPTNKPIRSGTAEVSKSGDMYHITMNFVFTDGSSVQNAYHGKLEYKNLSKSFLEDVNVREFNQGSLSYYGMSENNSNFFITTLLGSGLSFETDGSVAGTGYALVLQMYTNNTSETEIAAGTYTVSDTKNAGTLFPGFLFWGMLHDGTVLHKIEDGEFVNTIYAAGGAATFSGGADSGYNIRIALEDEYGFNIVGSYTGELDYQDKSSGDPVAPKRSDNNKYQFESFDLSR